MAAASSVLGVTTQTMKLRIREGKLNAKTFFVIEPDRKSWAGVEAGSLKSLLEEKERRRARIKHNVDLCASKGVYMNYSQVMNDVGMDWHSPPDRKYINQVLEEINHQSFKETIDAGSPCLKGCVVVSINEGIPTDSFFRCAVELGVCEVADIENLTHRREFWQEQFDLTKQVYGGSYEQ
ncbi:hypothetical protein THO17_16880 [Marinomonas sp. THO17]